MWPCMKCTPSIGCHLKEADCPREAVIYSTLLAILSLAVVGLISSHILT